MEQEYAEEMGAQEDVFGGEEGAKRRAGKGVPSPSWILGCFDDVQAAQEDAFGGEEGAKR